MSTMPNKLDLILDTFSVVYDLLKPFASQEFWEFADHVPVTGATYVIGRKQLVENRPRVRAMCESAQYRMVFDGAAEGSWTLIEQIRMLGIEDLVLSKQLLLLSGGVMPAEYPALTHDHFFNVILGYDENLQQMQRMPEIYNTAPKPCDFLFLNGRARPHRKYLWERLNQLGLLDRAIWSMLDGRPTLKGTELTLMSGNVDLMTTVTPIRQLDSRYEVARYQNNSVEITAPKRQFIKQDMFQNTWGEIYLQTEPYADTYFSLVTETICEHGDSFRTEKIAKPIAQGHPWIVASNAGFYRDLRNLGFQTFGHVIDESFDLIDNTQDRLNRIVKIVQDLCSQDLAKFLNECYNVCKYNQQHLQEYREQLRRDFPQRFFDFLQEHTLQ